MSFPLSKTSMVELFLGFSSEFVVAKTLTLSRNKLDRFSQPIIIFCG
jgi:hypothetical protein